MTCTHSAPASCPACDGTQTCDYEPWDPTTWGDPDQWQRAQDDYESQLWGGTP